MPKGMDPFDAQHGGEALTIGSRHGYDSFSDGAGDRTVRGDDLPKRLRVKVYFNRTFLHKKEDGEAAKGTELFVGKMNLLLTLGRSSNIM